MTLIGLIVSAFGGLIVGLAYYITLILTVSRDQLSLAPPQWPIIVLAITCGLLGSIIDSILGATVQYSGCDKKTGKIVEEPGDGIVRICGRRWLDNHSVNLLSTLITGALAPILGTILWTWVE